MSFPKCTYKKTKNLELKPLLEAVTLFLGKFKEYINASDLHPEMKKLYKDFIHLDLIMKNVSVQHGKCKGLLLPSQKKKIANETVGEGDNMVQELGYNKLMGLVQNVMRVNLLTEAYLKKINNENELLGLQNEFFKIAKSKHEQKINEVLRSNINALHEFAMSTANEFDKCGCPEVVNLFQKIAKGNFKDAESGLVEKIVKEAKNLSKTVLKILNVVKYDKFASKRELPKELDLAKHTSNLSEFDYKICLKEMEKFINESKLFINFSYDEALKSAKNQKTAKAKEMFAKAYKDDYNKIKKEFNKVEKEFLNFKKKISKEAEKILK